jgi:hypothetical protein
VRGEVVVNGLEDSTCIYSQRAGNRVERSYGR